MDIIRKDLSFCCSWVSKTQSNHRTNRMMYIVSSYLFDYLFVDFFLINPPLFLFLFLFWS